MNENELAIGSIGIINGVKVECVKESDECIECGKCAFYLTSVCSKIGDISPCGAGWRSDHTNVYFKRIEP